MSPGEYDGPSSIAAGPVEYPEPDASSGESDGFDPILLQLALFEVAADPDGVAATDPYGGRLPGLAGEMPADRAGAFESPVRVFPNETVAAFATPGALGITLAEGIGHGIVPKGMNSLLQMVEHTTPIGVSTPLKGLFPLPVCFSREFQTGDACETSAWLQLVCHGLNRLAGIKKAAPPVRQGAQVTRVLACLKSRIDRFLSLFSPLVVAPSEIWQDVLSKKISYDGEEFAEPLPLTWRQIEKSLPPAGHGGSVDLLPLLVGRARYLVQNPEELLLGPEAREPGPNKAQVHIAPGEKLEVWQLLRERGIVDWLELEQVYSDAGGPFLSGMFGVAKAGRFTESGDPLLRVIMNLRPINRALAIIQGDIAELPSAMAWCQLALEEDETIHVSQADMSSAFYLFRLPRAWHRFLGFNAKFNGKLLGLDHSKVYVPVCKVLPMGWSSSVGLMQMASRELIRRGDQLGAEELRRQAVAPGWFVDLVLRAGPQQFWQVYLDNYMSGEVSLKGLESSTSAVLHQGAVAAWTGEGVLCAEDKHVLAARDAVELGVNINGDAGLVGGSPERLHKLVVATLMLLGQTLPRVKWVQILLGRWIFVLQFRRPAMAALSKCWNYVKKGQDRRRWWPVVQQELSTLLCLLPLLHTDLRVSFSDTTTCSDASHFGGAVASAVSLTGAGSQLTHRLQSRELEPIQANLLVVSAFNGIGGAFRGYDLAGVRPAALISIEWDRAAQRVTRKAWPHVLEIGDIETISRATVQEWFNTFPRVTRVHLIGGFPCVHLSSARAGRQNLEGEGSRLFWTLLQLLRWLREVFEPLAVVDFVVENVLSMDVSARVEISQWLGVEPLALCPSDILPYNRPRLAWVSAPVTATEGTCFTKQGDLTRVHMSGAEVADHQWIDDGWSRYNPDGKLPTFMKAIPRSRPPPRPAGLSRCNPACCERWQSDRFRFPPYQYLLEHLLVNKEGDLRYPNAGERERLLGFGCSHTMFAWPANKVKGAERDFEDIRLSLCGDSFSMLSFGWVISQLCKPYRTPLAPAMIIARMGLAPGCGLAGHLAAPIQKRLCYGPPPDTAVAAAQLTAHLSRHVNHTGSDVSLALGVPFTNKGASHVTLRADWWTWRILFTTKWKFHNHINYLEMKMILQSIKWRARFGSSCNSRWLHLSDSMVSNYILSKGRTSSSLLQPLTREIAA